MKYFTYFTSITPFNSGIDLHTRQVYVCLMDRYGKSSSAPTSKNNDFAFFLKRVEPYNYDLTVCAECMFGWHWLADACQAAGLKSILATPPQTQVRKKLEPGLSQGTNRQPTSN
jgi:hypothetical protein